MDFSRVIPALDWMKNYRKEWLRGDIAAGLTVGVMLIPQGMAYALIAGLPPIYGLYASTVPLVLYALLGTSRQLAVGPVAMVSLLTATGVGVLAEGGTETYIQLALTLALMVGLLQFLLGAFRLGFLVNFLSHPVISGFTSAAALIIGLSQLKHLLGIPIPRSHHIHEILLHAAGQIEHIHGATLAIGLGGILLILSARKIHPAVPGALLTVLFGILAVWLLGLDKQGVQIVGEVPQGLPSFAAPRFDGATLEALLPTALAIALVSFMESIAVAKAVQAKHKNYRVDSNQELVALGIANIGGSFFQSYPVTGGFSRTAVNDQAGAKTGLASIISALLIVLTLLFLTPLFHYLPKAVLASVIMVAVFGLIDLKEARYLWKANRADFWMLAATFVGTLTLGIEQGIGLGVVLSLAVILFRTTRPHVAVLGRVPGTDLYRNLERFDKLEIRPDVLVFRFDAQLYFANAGYFKDRLEELAAAKKDRLRAIVIEAASINNLDSSALHTLQELIEDFGKQGVRVLFSGVKGPVRDALARGGLLEKIGPDAFFLSIQQAVDSLDRKGKETTEDPALRTFTLQSNTPSR
ncbi:MAG: solute carrier 26 family protein [Bacteroidetes bacterium]|nr:MAG: solute carrier 26 family protein [Bacteroidota bacterium]